MDNFVLSTVQILEEGPGISGSMYFSLGFVFSTSKFPFQAALALSAFSNWEEKGLGQFYALGSSGHIYLKDIFAVLWGIVEILSFNLGRLSISLSGCKRVMCCAHYHHLSNC